MAQKNARVYVLEPTGLMDLGSAYVRPHIGAEVQKVQPHGCPRNGTMRMCYVQTLDGDFIGLVCEASLVRTKKTAPLRDKAAEAREARSAAFRRPR